MEEKLQSKVAHLAETLSHIRHPVTLHRISEGSNFAVWKINDTHVIRVGLISEIRTALARESLVLELLSGRFPQGLIPQCLVHGLLDGLELEYGLYPAVQGVSLEDNAEYGFGLEEGLVELLLALKAVPVQAAEALGVPPAERIDVEKLRSEAVEVWDVEGSEDLTTRSAVDFDDTPQFHTCVNHPRVLLHNDLKGEHIFVSHDSLRLTGVIDWADAAIGCPAWDIAGLAISVGASMASRIGVAAGYERYVVEEGIAVARCHMKTLLGRKRMGEDTGPRELLVSQLNKAFEPYSN